MQPPAPGADGHQLFQEASAAAERGEYEQAATLYSRLIGNPDPTMSFGSLSPAASRSSSKDIRKSG